MLDCTFFSLAWACAMLWIVVIWPALQLFVMLAGQESPSPWGDTMIFYLFASLWAYTDTWRMLCNTVVKSRHLQQSVPLTGLFWARVWAWVPFSLMGWHITLTSLDLAALPMEDRRKTAFAFGARAVFLLAHIFWVRGWLDCQQRLVDSDDPPTRRPRAPPPPLEDPRETVADLLPDGAQAVSFTTPST